MQARGKHLRATAERMTCPKSPTLPGPQCYKICCNGSVDNSSNQGVPSCPNWRAPFKDF